MKPLRLCLLGLALGLAACGPESPRGDEPADAPLTAAPAAHPVAEETPGVIDRRAVSRRGVGPLRPETPFDREAVAALFPNAEVQAEFLHFGEETTPILTVTGQQETVLEIQGGPDGRVSQIVVLGGPFEGPGGARLLDSWPELGLAAADCVMGEGRFTGAPVCRREDAPNVALVLSVPGWTETDLPDPTTLNGRARLSAYVWTRP